MPSIFTTIVPPDEDTSTAANTRREQMACAVLEHAHKEGAQLLVFPAGFLRARNGDVEASARTLLAKATDLGVAIIFGIDTDAKSISLDAKHEDHRIAEESLPYFIVAKSKDDGPYYWRQRSSTSWNGYNIPAGLLAPRSLQVDHLTVDVFACGEIFSRPLRDRLESWDDRILVVPTHTAQGSRFFRAVEWAQGAGVRAILRATHAWSPATSTGSQTEALGQVGGVYVYRWG
ncbi:MAG TPA: hypothetical protein VFP84_33830 [Kofleriaceae bacterium]|nr:hypothetical protein [Kofleriaceae bacterium]